jgi:hypothetical protein
MTLVPKQDTEHCNICSKAFANVFQHAIASRLATSIVRCTFLSELLAEYDNICKDFITLSEYEFYISVLKSTHDYLINPKSLF